jgi:hypothetical protein
MYTPLHHGSPEMEALIEALVLRKSFFHLKARLLRGVRKELLAARDSGLTWLAIWSAMRDTGYPGGYQQFCKAANELTRNHAPSSLSGRENLPPPAGEKEINQPVVSRADRTTENKEKPAWQRQREEIMAKLDREAEQNREREASLSRPKKFVMTPFVGRGED